MRAIPPRRVIAIDKRLCQFVRAHSFPFPVHALVHLNNKLGINQTQISMIALRILCVEKEAATDLDSPQAAALMVERRRL